MQWDRLSSKHGGLLFTSPIHSFAGIVDLRSVPGKDTCEGCGRAAVRRKPNERYFPLAGRVIQANIISQLHRCSNRNHQHGEQAKGPQLAAFSRGQPVFRPFAS